VTWALSLGVRKSLTKIAMAGALVAIPMAAVNVPAHATSPAHYSALPAPPPADPPTDAPQPPPPPPAPPLRWFPADDFNIGAGEGGGGGAGGG
jgi:hypothetical protein